jgi:L-serine dehydratase
VALSVFDLFSIGIGPSSSHTVGPMRAARMFARRLKNDGLLAHTAAVRVRLHGSLAATGPGHGTPGAVLLGLEGASPRTVDVDRAAGRLAEIRATGRLALLGAHEIGFTEADGLVLDRQALPRHPNGMVCAALDSGGAELARRTYYSVGGGFVVDEEAAGEDRVRLAGPALPYPFRTADELLRLTGQTGLSVSGLMLENEKAFRPEAEIRSGLLTVWSVMRDCVARGLSREGVLPGGLAVRRRAAHTARQLRAAGDPAAHAMEWTTLYAMAVNEENAAGGRVVTAPTNGAAGIVPAVLHTHLDTLGTRSSADAARDEDVVRFLLAAGAIGMLFKENASISGAEVGCQGEVGSACSMAAAGLAEVLGGTPAQVENAAEIGIEHNLGLTCDPVGGLVQIPCIERNGMAAVKAVTAARLALRGDGRHHVSLDRAIRTMKETGADMAAKYKETSLGGLAVNVIEC